MPNALQSPHGAIVGAGPGGLASAMLLAREGVSVTTFEGISIVGGPAHDRFTHPKSPARA